MCWEQELLRAVNFVREISDKDVHNYDDVPKREKAALLYMFLKSVSYGLEGKQNTVATVISHITGNAEVSKKSSAERVMIDE